MISINGAHGEYLQLTYHTQRALADLAVNVNVNIVIDADVCQQLHVLGFTCASKDWYTVTLKYESDMCTLYHELYHVSRMAAGVFFWTAEYSFFEELHAERYALAEMDVELGTTIVTRAATTRKVSPQRASKGLAKEH